MGKLLGALEGVNLHNELECDFASMELDMMLCEQELRECRDELSMLQDECESANASVERLFGISDAADKYGLSVEMLEAADPNAELFIAGCIDEADFSLEGHVEDQYKSVINAYNEKHRQEKAAKFAKDHPKTAKFAKEHPVGFKIAAIAIGAIIGGTIGFVAGKIGEQLGKLSGVWLRSRLTYENALKNVKEQLGGLSIDDAKFKAHMVESYKVADFHKVIEHGKQLVGIVDANGPIKFAEELAAIIGSQGAREERIDGVLKHAGNYFKPVANEEVVRYLGINITFTEKGGLSDIRRSKPSIDTRRGTAGELGWSAGKVKSAVDEALATMRGSFELVNNLEKISKSCRMVANEIKSKSKREGTFDAETKAVYKKAVGQIHFMITANHVLAIQTMWGLKNVAGSAVSLGKAAIASKSVE